MGCATQPAGAARGLQLLLADAVMLSTPLLRAGCGTAAQCCILHLDCGQGGVRNTHPSAACTHSPCMAVTAHLPMNSAVAEALVECTALCALHALPGYVQALSKHIRPQIQHQAGPAAVCSRRPPEHKLSAAADALIVCTTLCALHALAT